jgi:hypothetical protein
MPGIAYAQAYGSSETWDNVMSGIRRYSSDRKLREAFDDLCREKKTAVVNGKVDTGGGLYMIMDVPVYSQPGISKLTELEHETLVVLTGDSREVNGCLWNEIDFLFISDYSKSAVSIDKAWIQEASLIKSDKGF